MFSAGVGVLTCSDSRYHHQDQDTWNADIRLVLPQHGPLPRTGFIDCQENPTHVYNGITTRYETIPARGSDYGLNQFKKPIKPTGTHNL